MMNHIPHKNGGVFYSDFKSDFVKGKTTPSSVCICVFKFYFHAETNMSQEYTLLTLNGFKCGFCLKWLRTNLKYF